MLYYLQKQFDYLIYLLTYYVLSCDHGQPNLQNKQNNRKPDQVSGIRSEWRQDLRFRKILWSS